MAITQSDFLTKYNIKEDDFQKTNLEWEELEEIYKKHINDTPILESYLQSLFSRFSKLPRVHSVRYRVKDAEHLIEKIIRKKMADPNRNLSYETYFDELDDLVGIKILHLFKDEWKPIHDYIMDNWNLKETPTAYYRKGDDNEYLNEYHKKKCNPKEHEFGYRSVHYIITENILSVKLTCEIQVRTVFEEAWSEIDHEIRYPYDINNPIFKQYLLIFNRLSGSADEMGAFLITLKEHLAKLHYEARQEQEQERAKSNKIIEELRKEISELKISNKKANSIYEKLERLDEETNTVDIERAIDYSYLSNFSILGQGINNIPETLKTYGIMQNPSYPSLCGGITDSIINEVSKHTAWADTFKTSHLGLYGGGITDSIINQVSKHTAWADAFKTSHPGLYGGGITDSIMNPTQIIKDHSEEE